MDNGTMDIARKMNNNVNKLKKFNRENPGILKIIQDDCPSEYGLKIVEGIRCNGQNCVYCWEQALENIKDE